MRRTGRRSDAADLVVMSAFALPESERVAPGGPTG